MPEQYRKTESYQAVPEPKPVPDIEKLTPEMAEKLKAVPIGHADPRAICTGVGWSRYIDRATKRLAMVRSMTNAAASVSK